MGSVKGALLSRDEIDLLRYYRGLSAQEQFEILEQAESRFNTRCRMAELAGRGLDPRDWSETHRRN